MRLLNSLKTEHRRWGEEGFWTAVTFQKDIANSEAPVGTGTAAAKHKNSQVQVKYLQKYPPLGTFSPCVSHRARVALSMASPFSTCPTKGGGPRS